MSALVLAASCASHPRDVVVSYAMPGPPGRYHRVEIRAGGDYFIRTKRRSYHVSDPMKGVAVREGRMDKRDLRAFVDSLQRLGLGEVDQQRVHGNMRKERRRRARAGESSVWLIADGGDYSFSIDADSLSFRFEKNAIPQYAEVYPDITGLQTIARAIKEFQALTRRLWELGSSTTRHAERRN
jgi:hypothetical protein